MEENSMHSYSAILNLFWRVFLLALSDGIHIFRGVKSTSQKSVYAIWWGEKKSSK